MARINVEDDFFADPRFRALSRVVGDEAKALGLCVQAWFLGQKYWVEGKSLVPDGVWSMAGLDDLLKVDLASLRDGQVYCRGAEKHFGWLLDLHAARSSAGRRSVEVRREKYGSAQPSRPEQTEQTPNSCSNKLEQPAEQTRTLFTPAPAPAPALLGHNYMSEPAGSRPPSPLDLAKLWNEKKSASQPKLNLDTFKPKGKRWVWAQKRLLDNPDLAYWAEVIERIAKSHWCNGANDRSWKADFEFLVRQETHIKVAEGKYDGGASTKAKPAMPIFNSIEELNRE